MQVLENSHAWAHERAYEAQQQAADDREAYQDWIAAQADSVLLNQAPNRDVIDDAQACIVGSKFEDNVFASFYAWCAGDIELATKHKQAAQALIEREIQGVLADKTPMSKWRKAHRELSYEY
ncbi:hypothetical protein E8K88_11815 [Lampropedia aestuarii]|uniref:Uncharacterized protein n=1 Tax=Lampropedia aestuarii TaxID=2562762 RepID=A0A4S5BMT6_9BURK|nr:hypothetical protein [Lampropedia aestuarii]THJ32383.1 hypothetical protein E8K88_11815 [Lampropedia aestuarii]